MTMDERTKRKQALEAATKDAQDMARDIADKIDRGEIENEDDRDELENYVSTFAANNIRKLRKERGWSQGELAEKANSTTSQISRLERGDLQLTVRWLELIAHALKCKPYQLIANIRETVQVPVIGWVSAGHFTNAESVAIPDIDRYDMIECAGVNPATCFALRIEGDSMNMIAPEGSTIIVDVSNKEPVDKKFYVVANNGGEATFKQFKNSPPRLEPCSTNPAHETIFPKGEIHVVGRVIQVIHDL